jgi:hypothetical protein
MWSMALGLNIIDADCPLAIVAKKIAKSVYRIGLIFVMLPRKCQGEVATSARG